MSKLEVVHRPNAGVDQNGFRRVAVAPPPMGHLRSANGPQSQFSAAEPVKRRGDAPAPRVVTVGVGPDEITRPMTPTELEEYHRANRILSEIWRRDAAASQYRRLFSAVEGLQAQILSIRPRKGLRPLPVVDPETDPIENIEAANTALQAEWAAHQFILQEAQDWRASRPVSEVEELRRQLKAQQEEIDALKRGRGVKPMRLAGG